MNTVAILGSGDLAATAARRLAELELARRIVMVDANEGRAKGKALDLAQSGPVERYDARLEGCAELKGVGGFDVLLVADPPALEDPVLSPGRAMEFVKSLLGDLHGAIVIVAGINASALVEAGIQAGLPRQRILGSIPIALSAAVRRRLAAELDVAPREVAATVMGLPPSSLFVAHGSATVGGVPIEGLSAVALRRATEAVTGRLPGPVALATGAVRIVQALCSHRPSALPVVAALEGEYGHRGVALAVPAQVAVGGLRSILEVPLEPVDRVAFDNAAGRRYATAR